MPLTSLARPLDFSYPSNRLAAAGLVGGALLGWARRRGVRAALSAGADVFAAWAIARELDPDDAGSAALALALAAPSALLPPGGAATGGALLQALRTLSGTTGLRPTDLDAFVLGGASGLSAGTGGGVAALAPGLALWLSANVHDELSPPRWTAAVAGAGQLAAALSKRPSGEARGGWALKLAALAALGATWGATRAGPVGSLCDNDRFLVSGERVSRARQLTVGLLAAGTLTEGAPGVRRLWPLWAAWLAVAARRSLA